MSLVHGKTCDFEFPKGFESRRFENYKNVALKTACKYNLISKHSNTVISNTFNLFDYLKTKFWHYLRKNTCERKNKWCSHGKWHQCLLEQGTSNQTLFNNLRKTNFIQHNYLILMLLITSIISPVLAATQTKETTILQNEFNSIEDQHSPPNKIFSVTRKNEGKETSNPNVNNEESWKGGSGKSTYYKEELQPTVINFGQLKNSPSIENENNVPSNEQLLLDSFHRNHDKTENPMYTNDFAVHIPAGLDAATNIAEKHGFTNLGQVSISNRCYFPYKR